MNTPKLPPLPKPDTHCFDEDTGKDVWSHSPEQTQAYALAAIEALWAQLGQGVPVAWLVCSVNKDGSLSLEHAAAWQEAAHEHINDAITEHGIADAASWVVRPAYTHPSPQQIGQGEPDGLFESQIEPRPLLYPLSDYHRAMTDGPLHYTWIDKPHRLVYDLIAAVRYYASAPPAPQANKTHVLVPLRMTSAMQDVVSEEDWSWAELLAAAEAATEDECAVAEQAEPIMPQAAVMQQKPLTDEQITGIWIEYEGRELSWRRLLARAIETAAAEPLLQRIAELERQLDAMRAQIGQGEPDGLRAEAKKLAPILASMGEGGYDLETLYVEDPVDGDCFVKRAADLLLLLAFAQPAPQAERCPLCKYQHGQQIGCENNPVDIALRAQAARGIKE